MSFFSAQANFEGNLQSAYVVKVLTVGITILGRRDSIIKKVREMLLKVKGRRNVISQAYELIFAFSFLFLFLIFGVCIPSLFWFLRVNFGIQTRAGRK